MRDALPVARARSSSWTRDGTAAGALAYEALLAGASPTLDAGGHPPRRHRVCGSTPPAPPAGRRPPCTSTTTSCPPPIWSGRACSASGPTTGLLGLEDVLRLRPRQLALLPGARGRGLRARARARRSRARSSSVIAAERPTVLFTVPTLYARLLEVPGRRAPLRSLVAAALRVLGRGAAARGVRRLAGALRPRAARRGRLHRGAPRLHRQPARPRAPGAAAS